MSEQTECVLIRLFVKCLILICTVCFYIQLELTLLESYISKELYFWLRLMLFHYCLIHDTNGTMIDSLMICIFLIFCSSLNLIFLSTFFYLLFFLLFFHLLSSLVVYSEFIKYYAIAVQKVVFCL